MDAWRPLHGQPPQQLAIKNIALVVGVNDATNAAARRSGTTVSGMPSWTLTSHSMLSSLSEAREGIRRHRENGLYLNPNTQKLFNAAKVSIQVIIASAKDLIDRASAG